MMPFFMLVTIAYLELSVTGFRVARSDQFHTHAQFAADAAVDISIDAIGQNDNWPGTGGEIDLHDDGTVRTTYQSVMTTIDADNKTITATGRTYHPASSTTARSSVIIEATLRPVKTGGFSVVGGVGGLVMRNSSKIVGGSVYVNGTINMSLSSQIGLAALPVDVKVAHQSCPTGASPGPTYPVICASGEPLSISGSAHIYGDVEANNQTNGSGMSDGGLAPPVPRPIPPNPNGIPTIALPGYDRDLQKTSVSSTYSGNYSCNSGSVTWPANYKVQGDVTLSNSCIVTVEGNLWITGNLRMSNSAQLVVKSGLSVTPVIMIDGPSGLHMRNSSTMLPNSGQIGFRLITYYSTDSCSPDCASVTGNALYNSQSVITIDLDQSVNGGNTEFYARWTKLTAGNNGSIGALVAQTVELKNSIAVTFGTSVTGLTDITWVIDGYRRTFN